LFQNEHRKKSFQRSCLLQTKEETHWIDCTWFRMRVGLCQRKWDVCFLKSVTLRTCPRPQKWRVRNWHHRLLNFGENIPSSAQRKQESTKSKTRQRQYRKPSSIRHVILERKCSPFKKLASVSLSRRKCLWTLVLNYCVIFLNSQERWLDICQLCRNWYREI
jgi:hypothetical protein